MSEGVKEWSEEKKKVRERSKGKKSVKKERRVREKK